MLNHAGHARRGLFAGTTGWRERVDGLAVDFGQEREEVRVRGRGGVFGRWREEMLVAHGRDERHRLDIVRET